MARRPTGKMGRPAGISKGGAKDIWAGGYKIDCITCKNKPGKREECGLCKGEGRIKVRPLVLHRIVTRVYAQVRDSGAQEARRSWCGYTLDARPRWETWGMGGPRAGV